jgi:endonuclease YncB( thermonuclease family)
LWFNHLAMWIHRLFIIFGLIWLATACTLADPTRLPTRTQSQVVTRPSLPEKEPTSAPVTATIRPGALETPNAVLTATPSRQPSLTPTLNPLACLPGDPGETGLVSWVIDGETIVIDQNGKRETVRLLGVAALPLTEETTRSMLDRRVVRLVPDGRNADPNGRLLRYVLLLDGHFINDELLRSGVARLDPDVRGLACMAQFKSAEEWAIQEGLGIWGMTAVAVLPTGLQPTPSAAQSTTLTEEPGTVTPSPTITLAPPGGTNEIPIPPAPVNPGIPPAPPGPGVTPTQTVAPTTTRPSATGTQVATGVQIVYIFYDGVKSEAEPDEYIEIKNFTTAPVDLSYWLINAEAYELWYIFPEPTILQPGQSCRVYTNEVNPDSCAGDSFLEPMDDWQVWYNTADCGYLYNYADPNPVSTLCYGQ